MRHKILVIGQIPPPIHGSNIMTELFLQSLMKLGYHTTIVEKKFSMRIEDVGKKTIFKLFKIPIITSKLIYCLILKKFNICFYFLSINPPSIFIDTFFLFFIRMFRVRYVLYLHGKGLVDLDEKISQPIRSFVKNLISQSLGALVLGERLKRDVSHLIPDGHLFVLPNAIPDFNLEKRKINFKKRGPIKLLFLSTLIPSKGPLEFLKMARKINKIDQNVHFTLAGPKRSNKFFNQILNFIHNESLGDFITIPGPIFGEQKDTLFANNDIFIFPTLNEAFGLVNLEAMRAGLPIVSSDEGGIPEIVIDGVNGFIVNPKNIDMLTERVLKLIQDPELRIKMGCASRKIFEKKYTIASYQKRLEQGLEFFFKLKGKSGGQSIKPRKSVTIGNN